MVGITTKTVPVVSSVVFSNTGEVSCGGFEWYFPDTTNDYLIKAFNSESDIFKNEIARVRLVQVPDVPAYLEGNELTEYLDAERLDDIEVHLKPMLSADFNLNEDKGAK